MAEQGLMHIICKDDEDNVAFERDVPRQVLLQSNMIKDMVECCGDCDYIPLPLFNMKSERHFDLAMQYCEYMLAEEFPHDRDPENIEGDLTEWEKNYMEQLDSDTLYDLIMVANFLYIPYLLEALCFWAAEGIKGKSPEEIREQLGIENDLTQEEEEEIENENKFVDRVLD